MGWHPAPACTHYVLMYRTAHTHFGHTKFCLQNPCVEIYICDRKPRYFFSRTPKATSWTHPCCTVFMTPDTGSIEISIRAEATSQSSLCCLYAKIIDWGFISSWLWNQSSNLGLDQRANQSISQNVQHILWQMDETGRLNAINRYFFSPLHAIHSVLCALF